MKEKYDRLLEDRLKNQETNLNRLHADELYREKEVSRGYLKQAEINQEKLSKLENSMIELRNSEMNNKLNEKYKIMEAHAQAEAELKSQLKAKEMEYLASLSENDTKIKELESKHENQLSVVQSKLDNEIRENREKVRKFKEEISSLQRENVYFQV